MRRSRFVIGLLLLAACGGDSTGPDTIAGRYNLVSVNGESLPFVLAQVVDDKIEVTGGHFQINDDGTCSTGLTLTVTVSGEVRTETESTTCTWSQNGTAVAFTYSEGGSDAGSIVGDTLSITSEGAVFLFER